MKKFGLLSMMLICLFLVGCGSNTPSPTSQQTKISKNDIFENNLKCQEYFNQNQQDLLEEGATDVLVFYSPIKNECWISYQTYNPTFDNSWECHNDYYVSRPLFDRTWNGDYVMYVNSNCFWDSNLTIIKDVVSSVLNRECISFSDAGDEKYDDIGRNSTKEECHFGMTQTAFLEEVEYLKGN